MLFAFLALPSLHQVNLPIAAADSFADIGASFFCLQHGLKTNDSPETHEAFGTSGHPALWAKQLLASHPLSYKATTVGSLPPYFVIQYNKSTSKRQTCIFALLFGF